jgi:hypothetical protein
VLKFITLLKKESPLTFNLYVPGSVVPIATLPVLLLYILVPDVVQTEAVDDIGFPPTLNVPDILTSPNTSTLYVADGALPIPTLPVSVLVPVIDTSLAKVAKPAELIVNRATVLVDNVKAPTPFADIESGIDTSFPSTIIEPADILVNAVIGPQDIFVVAVQYTPTALALAIVFEKILFLSDVTVPVANVKQEEKGGVLVPVPALAVFNKIELPISFELKINKKFVFTRFSPFFHVSFS